MTDASWYRVYFDERYLRQYAPVFPPEHTSEQVDRIVDRLALEPGAKILDLACGHGRHAIPLALRGYDVTGLDLSTVFLERAEADAREAGAEVEWVHADMREIPYADTFDAVINIFTAFGYLEDEAEDQKVVSAVHRALRGNGAFLLETLHRDALVRRFQRRMFEKHEEDEIVVLHDHTFDLGQGRIDDRVTTIEKGQVLAERFTSVRLYTVPEFRRLFEKAGLTLEAFWGGLGGDELTLDSYRLALLGRKR